MARRYDDDDTDRISVPIVLAFIPILGVLAFVGYRWTEANKTSPNTPVASEMMAISGVAETDSDDPNGDDVTLDGGPAQTDAGSGDDFVEDGVDTEPDLKTNGDTGAGANIATDADGDASSESEDRAFNPPPSPQPLPVPEPIQITVYFELMKASLTPEAAELLTAQMRDVSGYDIASVRIDGYTDTAGTPSYNAPLSRRRAETVRAALIDLGAPAARVAAVGHGETTLAVQTPDGVREPGNRRAIARFTFE
ncbi:MAG: OmpA family protein [Pseudomonadota bacterium]